MFARPSVLRREEDEAKSSFNPENQKSIPADVECRNQIEWN